MNRNNNFESLRNSKLLQKRLAKYIAHFCLREGTILQDLHAGPDPQISHDDMHTLMIRAVQDCYTIVGLLIDEMDDRPGLILALANNALAARGRPRLLDALRVHDFNPEWNEPIESDGGAGRRLLGLPAGTRESAAGGPMQRSANRRAAAKSAAVAETERRPPPARARK